MVVGGYAIHELIMYVLKLVKGTDLDLNNKKLHFHMLCYRISQLLHITMAYICTKLI